MQVVSNVGGRCFLIKFMAMAMIMVMAMAMAMSMAMPMAMSLAMAVSNFVISVLSIFSQKIRGG